MSKDYITAARRIKKAGSKMALDKASRIAEKLCSFGSVSDEQLDKLVEMAEIKSIQLANPGIVRTIH